MFFLKAACCPCFGALEDESVTVDVATSPVNLNSASQSELEALPGIGSARAAAIVQYRLEHGHFTALDSLLQVPGIGPATVGKLHGLACCSSGPPRPPPRPPAPPRPSGPAAGEGSHEAFFFPDRSAENGVTALLRALEDARASLDVAVYAISHAPLANALLAAHERGVRVRVLTDDEQAKDGKSQCSALRRAGVPVRCDRSARLHMHHKFAVVDGGPLLAHGSFNWSGGAATGNHENLVLSRCAPLARRFGREFERLWRAFGPEGASEAGGERRATEEEEEREVGGDLRVLFFPEPEGRRGAHLALLLAELRAATASLDVAMFTFTHDQLAGELLAAHARGVLVRVLTDGRQAKCSGADAVRLRTAGVPVRLDASFYAFHHKFCVVDGRTLLNGSFNWTAQAASGNQESLVLFRAAPELAASFAAQFDRMWTQFAPKEASASG